MAKFPLFLDVLPVRAFGRGSKALLQALRSHGSTFPLSEAEEDRKRDPVNCKKRDPVNCKKRDPIN